MAEPRPARRARGRRPCATTPMPPEPRRRRIANRCVPVNVSCGCVFNGLHPRRRRCAWTGGSERSLTRLIVHDTDVALDQLANDWLDDGGPVQWVQVRRARELTRAGADPDFAAIDRPLRLEELDQRRRLVVLGTGNQPERQIVEHEWRGRAGRLLRASGPDLQLLRGASCRCRVADRRGAPGPPSGPGQGETRSRAIFLGYPPIRARQPSPRRS